LKIAFYLEFVYLTKQTITIPAQLLFPLTQLPPLSFMVSTSKIEANEIGQPS